MFLGSRSVERGTSALESIISGIEGKIEVVQCDVTDEASISAAANTVKAKLNGAFLYALVNNAGTGLQHGTDAATVNATNFYGPIACTNAFLPLLDPKHGRLVNVGSGAGPMWLDKQPVEVQQLLTREDITFEEIDALMKKTAANPDHNAYGLSKACLTSYTVWFSKQHPNLCASCLSPGFINTAIVAGWGATKPPEEGTVSIRHCLFKQLEGNGYFYGSDAVRSPFYPLRNPGQAPFTGVYPWSA